MIGTVVASLLFATVPLGSYPSQQKLEGLQVVFTVQPPFDNKVDHRYPATSRSRYGNSGAGMGRAKRQASKLPHLCRPNHQFAVHAFDSVINRPRLICSYQIALRMHSCWRYTRYMLY
jgi:hypothetical protein